MSEEGKTEENTPAEAPEEGRESAAEKMYSEQDGGKKEADAGKEKEAEAKDAKADDKDEGEGQDKKPEDGEADKGEGDDAPEYEAFSLPEGVEVDEELLDEFAGVAKEIGLKQDQAQKLVDLQAGMIQKQAETWKTTIEGWQKEAEADKEIGGANLEENLSIAKDGIGKVLDEKETEAFYEALELSGLGNHPAIIRPLLRIGKLLADDTIHRGRTLNGKQARTAAERMFGDMEAQSSG